jgi:N-methylhydantoinase A
MKLIGVDVGGTFTDLVLSDTETRQTRIHKVASTPDDPSIAVISGVTEICRLAQIEVAEIGHVFHGTTVATNAALQYKGSVAGMITTEGFRDIIHIGRHQRPQHYSIQQEIPWQARPLVLRRHRKTVTERLIPPSGEIQIALDEEQVRQVAQELKDEGVEAITICFLFSYLNPVHELQAKKIVQEQCPDIFVTTSHEVSPQYREFERFTTASMNAFIGPLVRDYVSNLEAKLIEQGIQGELHIMRSNGGVATAQAISESPVSTLMSGLAAGVLGGAWMGRLANRENVITFDIGGTSADIGVVTGGQFSEASARDTFVAGYPIMVPMIDLHTIGAGGGSIAHIDKAGAFKVGPQSAGAVPGPAAYDMGGDKATVTDANVVLGRLDKDNFLGGEMKLNADASNEVIQNLANSLNLSLLEAAEGVITLLNANMANAIRARTVQKGIDPREYALVASGGAGPLHGVEVARQLGIAEVIIPLYPGINSAMGLLTTDLKYDSIRTAFQLSTDIDFTRLQADFKDMEEGLFKQFSRDGIESGKAKYNRYADARYVGQGYELRIDLPAAELNENALKDSLQQFHQLHESEYGHSFPQSPIELVNIRITGIGTVTKIALAPKLPGGSLEDAQIKRDKTVFRIDGKLEHFETSFYDREKLPVGLEISGPAILLQTDTTTVVPPDCTFTVQANGLLIIKIANVN